MRNPKGVAIDLGASRVRVWVSGHGLVVDEPSLIAIDKKDRRRLAAGSSAKAMLGRTPAHIVVSRPFMGGALVNVALAEDLLSWALAKTAIRRPNLFLCVGLSLSPLERRALELVAHAVGARSVRLVESITAALMGAGIPLRAEPGTMVVDFGAGATGVAVLRHGGVAAARSVPVGGDDLDAAISDYLEKHHGLLLGPQTSEEAKLEVGSVAPMAVELRVDLSGRDLLTGLPRTVRTGAEDVREAIEPPFARCLGAVHALLESLPPVLRTEVNRSQILLVGGGALLRGVDRRLAFETGLEVRCAENPLTCALRGAGKIAGRFSR